MFNTGISHMFQTFHQYKFNPFFKNSVNYTDEIIKLNETFS